ncbi:RNA-binding protein [Pararhodospirillum oryzae]|uniref:YlxR domain-containing protein n=1 Tax=Pararhodospirillum oryzae TaxID=478448 RepID=A0A512HBM6_9PROT|nr:RNA-binding protein [Pararhodospirillum oryzae]GEO82842.1 hypothetical protein ROR02_29730 [Pararhodospirillum oryzae]
MSAPCVDTTNGDDGPSLEAESAPLPEDQGAEDQGAPVSVTDDREPDGPTRRCILTRAVRPREVMVRFVVAPDGVVIPDLDATLPGRGFWLSPGRDVVETATAKGSFARAARRAVSVPPDLAARVDHLLEERCVGLIGLARKAGQAVCGFEKVKALVASQRAAVVLDAWDGADDGRQKLESIAVTRGVPVFRALDRATLGRAFARSDAVHVALGPGGLARRLEADLIRLGRLRGRQGTGEENDPAARTSKGGAQRSRGTGGREARTGPLDPAQVGHRSGATRRTK